MLDLKMTTNRVSEEMNADEQHADSPDQPKSTSGPGFYSLSRCAACYNQHRSCRGGDGESSSSAEDSGPEVDSESDAESSSSSSICSGKASSDDDADPESGGKDVDGREETTSKSQEDKSRRKEVTRRAPLVKSFSLPASLTPRLIPLSLLSRPHTVVSTLNLQVLSQHHDDDAVYVIKKLEEKTEQSTGGGLEGVNNLLPLQTKWQQRSQPSLQQLTHQYHQQPHQLSHQYHQQPQQLSHQYHQQPHQLSHQYHQQPHQLSHQYHQQPQQLSHQYHQQPHQLSHQYHQQQQPQHFPPPSAQGQRLPPPLHTLPVLHPPALHVPPRAPNAAHAHLHALSPPACWYCYSMHFPYSPYWSHHSSGELPRQ